MRDVIEKVLAAESEARSILKAAESEADTLVQDARRQAKTIETGAEASAAEQLRDSLAAAGSEIAGKICPDMAAREQALSLLLESVAGAAGAAGRD